MCTVFSPKTIINNNKMNEETVSFNDETSAVMDLDLVKRALETGILPLGYEIVFSCPACQKQFKDRIECHRHTENCNVASLQEIQQIYVDKLLEKEFLEHIKPTPELVNAGENIEFVEESTLQDLEELERSPKQKDNDTSSSFDHHFKKLEKLGTVVQDLKEPEKTESNIQKSEHFNLSLTSERIEYPLNEHTLEQTIILVTDTKPDISKPHISKRKSDIITGEVQPNSKKKNDAIDTVTAVKEKKSFFDRLSKIAPVKAKEELGYEDISLTSERIEYPLNEHTSEQTIILVTDTKPDISKSHTSKRKSDSITGEVQPKSKKKNDAIDTVTAVKEKKSFFDRISKIAPVKAKEELGYEDIKVYEFRDADMEARQKSAKLARLNKKRTCNFCDKLFDDPMDVLRHKREAHNFQKKYIPAAELKQFYDVEDKTKCPICDRPIRGGYGSTFNKHLITHKEEYSFQCTICKMMFRRQDHKILHESRHII